MSSGDDFDKVKKDAEKSLDDVKDWMDKMGDKIDKKM